MTVTRFGKDLTEDEIRKLANQSAFPTLRTLVDLRTGNRWYWPAEDATHREFADNHGLLYELRRGLGELIVID